jgi:hypothetical protein
MAEAAGAEEEHSPSLGEDCDLKDAQNDFYSQPGDNEEEEAPIGTKVRCYRGS